LTKICHLKHTTRASEKILEYFDSAPTNLSKEKIRDYP